MYNEFTWNPRWGHNVIDKVKLMLFIPVLALKRYFEVCFVVYQVKRYVLYFIHLTFCADKVKILRYNTHHNVRQKSSP